MKKTFAFIGALLIAVSAASCSSGKVSSEVSRQEESITAVTVAQTVYKETRLDTELITQPLSVQTCGDRIYLFYENDTSEYRLMIIGGDQKIERDVLLCPAFNLEIAPYVHEDGTVTLVRADSDFQFEYNDFGTIENLGTFFRKGEARFYLTRLDAQGSVTSEEEIIGISSEFELSQSRLLDLCPYGEGRWILSIGNGLFIIDDEGNVIESEHYDMQRIRLGCDTEEKVIAAMYHNFAYMDGETVKMPDRLQEEVEEMLQIEGAFMPGNGDFKAFVQRPAGIFGLTADDELVLVFDFDQSLVKSADVNCFTSPSDGRFITAGYEGYPCIYDRRPDDFVNDRETIEIWYIGGGDGGSKAVEFSKSNDKYLAKVADSIKYPEDLTEAVLTGNAPDVIEYGDYTLLTKMRNLGAFADMNKLMDEYDYMKRDELMPNVLEAFTMDGAIYTLPSEFQCDCIYANKDYIGDEYADWSFEDMYHLYEQRPAGMLYCVEGGHANDTMIYELILNNLEPWVDQKNATCNFDSPEFIKLLNFSMEVKDSHIEHMTSGSEDEWNLYQTERLSMLREKKAMIDIAGGLYSLERMIHDTGEMQMSMEDVTILNQPGGDGTGRLHMGNCFAVMETSDCKEGAWAYVSYCLGEEYQCRLAERGCNGNFINKKAFEISMENSICRDGNPKMGGSGFQSENGVQFSIDYPIQVSPEQAEIYRKFATSCNKLKWNDYDVENIVWEEYFRFFNGEYTAEQCAAMIQNRVSIFLSETS